MGDFDYGTVRPQTVRRYMVLFTNLRVSSSLLEIETNAPLCVRRHRDDDASPIGYVSHRCSRSHSQKGVLCLRGTDELKRQLSKAAASS